MGKSDEVDDGVATLASLPIVLIELAALVHVGSADVVMTSSVAAPSRFGKVM